MSESIQAGFIVTVRLFYRRVLSGEVLVGIIVLVGGGEEG